MKLCAVSSVAHSDAARITWRAPLMVIPCRLDGERERLLAFARFNVPAGAIGRVSSVGLVLFGYGLVLLLRHSSQ